MRLTAWARLLCAPAALAAALTSSPAQASESPEITFKGGITFSSLYDLDGPPWATFESDAHVGFVVGPGIRVDLPGRFGLVFDAQWVRRRLDVEVEYEVSCCGNRSMALRTDHLELPLLARYELTAGETRPYVLAGPSLAFHLATRIDGSLVDFVQPTIVDPEHERGTRPFDVGLAAGAGVDLAAGRANGLLLEARMTWFARSLFEDGRRDPFVGMAAPKSRNLAVMAGYRF